MKYRMLGKNIKVSAVGMGVMGFSHGYGIVPERNESIRLIRKAYELGCTHFDTAEGYGEGDNEILLGEAVRPFRNEVVIATKLHIPDETRANLKQTITNHLDASLQRLGMETVDLYYQHRVNKNIPVEEVAQVMGDLIKEGKILGWGQSQPTEEEVRRAHAVTPLSAIQSEYSMMERMFERDVIPACKELGIGFVPFSPLASGFLSGKYTKSTVYVGDDVRRAITRFAPDNVEANQPLLDLLHQFAKEKGATPAQISLAWMLYKEDFIAPIPGMRKESRIVENLGAADVILSDEEYGKLEEALGEIVIHGNRTDEDIAKLRNLK